MDQNRPPYIAMHDQVNGSRGRGRPKKRWIDMVKKDHERNDVRRGATSGARKTHMENNAEDQGRLSPPIFFKILAQRFPPRIKVCLIGLIRNSFFTPDRQTPCTAHTQTCEDMDLGEWRLKC